MTLKALGSTVAPRIVSTATVSANDAVPPPRSHAGYRSPIERDSFETKPPPFNPFLEFTIPSPAVEGDDVGVAILTETRAELYGAAGPTLDDVRQGGVGDCWLMSSLGSLVNADPQRIRDMIRDDGNGTYSVRLFAELPPGSGTQVPVWIPVDDNLYRNRFSGDEVYAKARDTDGDGMKEIWPALIEKAMASYMDMFHPEEGMGYGALNDDTIARAMTALTGQPTDTKLRDSWSADQVWADLQRANTGGIVSVCTPRTGAIMPGLSQPHCYTVTGVVEINGHKFVDFRNPIGSGEPYDGGRPSDGIFRLSYEHFLQNFSEVASQPSPD